MIKSRCSIKDSFHTVLKEARRFVLGEADEIAGILKCVRTKTRLSIRKNLDQFVSIYAGVFVVFLVAFLVVFLVAFFVAFLVVFLVAFLVVFLVAFLVVFLGDV